MMRLFLNGLAASAGAGLTYIRNVVPRLSGTIGVHTIVALTPSLRKEFDNPANISFVEIEPEKAGQRFLREQTHLPRLITQSGAHVLISAGNFALRRSPVPQILLSGNSLYTSTDFYRDLIKRNEYRMWLDTRLRGVFAKWSVRWADSTIAPSEAFAGDLRRWTGASAKVASIYHGFDNDVFFRDLRALPASIEEKLVHTDGTLRLLFVSHYNYYRNFETIFRALPRLKRLLKPKKIRLILTCQLSSGANPGTYRTTVASDLVRQLGIDEEIVELGTVPYHQLHHVYRSCDLYVTAAYAETFAHPLVEAMASGLPVVASDLAVHQEICGTAGLYFDRFSSDGLANQVARIATTPELGRGLRASGLARSRDFSWHRHVEQIVALARALQSF